MPLRHLTMPLYRLTMLLRRLTMPLRPSAFSPYAVEVIPTVLVCQILVLM